jgi:hypothetical protein
MVERRQVNPFKLDDGGMRSLVRDEDLCSGTDEIVRLVGPLEELDSNESASGSCLGHGAVCSAMSKQVSSWSEQYKAQKTYPSPKCSNSSNDSQMSFRMATLSKLRCTTSSPLSVSQLIHFGDILRKTGEVGDWLLLLQSMQLTRAPKRSSKLPLLNGDDRWLFLKLSSLIIRLELVEGPCNIPVEQNLPVGYTRWLRRVYCR